MVLNLRASLTWDIMLYLGRGGVIGMRRRVLLPLVQYLLSKEVLSHKISGMVLMQGFIKSSICRTRLGKRVSANFHRFLDSSNLWPRRDIKSSRLISSVQPFISILLPVCCILPCEFGGSTSSRKASHLEEIRRQRIRCFPQQFVRVIALTVYFHL